MICACSTQNRRDMHMRTNSWDGSALTQYNVTCACATHFEMRTHNPFLCAHAYVIFGAHTQRKKQRNVDAKLNHFFAHLVYFLSFPSFLNFLCCCLSHKYENFSIWSSVHTKSYLSRCTHACASIHFLEHCFTNHISHLINADT